MSAMKNRTLRICIVGAGSSGLASARQMLDEGFEPVLFEKSDTIGGLWAYNEGGAESVPSVMRSTVANSSKEMSAFSDFPPLKEYANYMHNSKLLAYFRDYADHFCITPHVRLRHEVVLATPAGDYDDTGRWDVFVRNLTFGQEIRDTFDAVMVCTGHNSMPNMPKFRGQHKFRGSIVHTVNLKVPDLYKGRRVAVVGIGNSAVDAAVDISNVASEVYLSTRKGAWVARRVGPHGMPIDIFFTTRLKHWVRGLLPNRLSSYYGERFLNRSFDHEVFGLKPRHSINARHPTLNDELPSKLITGSLCLKNNVNEFTEDGILFEGDNEVTPLDDVVLGTGYAVEFPFLPKDAVPVVDGQVQAYKHVLPPDLGHPTLAIIGLVSPLGAIFPIAEMQARWVARLLAGHRKLPPKAVMHEDIDKKRRARQKQFPSSSPHIIQVNWVDYMDELAALVGASPKMLKYFFVDNELFRALLGPCVPYQFRLEGPHPWSGARDAILGVRARVLYPFGNSHHSENGSPRTFSLFWTVAVVLALLLVPLQILQP